MSRVCTVRGAARDLVSWDFVIAGRTAITQTVAPAAMGALKNVNRVLGDIGVPRSPNDRHRLFGV